ncbi:MAG: monovalent cation/H+ antiporter subunit D family protein [Methanocellales archaeon]|nr:monovalent cation/H+ antiporter subunit D family protein [Methanocellales archaeon]
MIEHFPILVVMVPLTAAYLMPVLGLWRKKLCHPLATASTFISFCISLVLAKSVMTYGMISYHLGGWAPPWGIELVVDYLSAFMCITITFISLLAVVYSKNYVDKELPKGKMTPYYTLLMLLIGGMLGVVVTGDMFNLFVLTEILSVAAYALVAISEKKRSYIASYKYLLLGAIGTSLILLGTGYLYIITGTLNMADLSIRLQPWYGSYVVFAALAFLMVGFGIKTALFPLHTWLPDAHSIAPSPISVILSALVIKVGAYAMIRILFTVFQPEFVTEVIPIASALAWVAAAAILIGSLFAISQTDVKRMLAYSSVAHIGYVMLGIGLATEMSTIGGILHIFNHALAKACLFFCAGAIIYKTGLRNINDLVGLGDKMPITVAAFTLAAISMIGLPPTAGFFSKWYLCIGAFEVGKWIFAIVILLASLLTAVFYFRVINLIYFGEHKQEGQVKVDEVSPSMLIPMVILALGCIIFGIFVGIPLSVVGPAVGLLLGI